MTRLVVDSSIVIKSSVPEDHSADALATSIPTWRGARQNCYWPRLATFFGRRSAGMS
jgi:hypothetical protein